MIPEDYSNDDSAGGFAVLAIILAASMFFMSLAGCSSTGQVDAMKVATAATQVTSIYFAQQQAQINLLPAGADRDKAQAKLYSDETTAALVEAVGQVVVNGVTTTQMPAVVPTTAPAPAGN